MPSASSNGNILLKVNMLVAQSCLIVCNLMNYIARQTPLFMDFSRQEYLSG